MIYIHVIHLLNDSERILGLFDFIQRTRDE
jgi:hypothetical protein